MPTAITFGTDRYKEPAVKPAVYTRASWDDAWTARGSLHCSVLRRGAGTQIDQATLRYEYGKMQRNGQAVADESAMNVLRHFVKITYGPSDAPTAKTWYGVILNEVRDELGHYTAGELEDHNNADLQDHNNAAIQVANANAGNQTFTAYGMEWLLTRVWINKSVYESATGADVTVNRNLPFNAGTHEQLDSHSLQVVGNRSPGKNRFITPAQVKDAVAWTAYDILDYLKDVFQPTVSPVWALHSSVNANADWWEQNNLTLGPTLYDAISELISQRRGLTWSVWSDPAENPPKIYLKVHSFAALSISLAGGATLPANGDQITIDDTDKRQAVSVRVTDTSRLFEQVKVNGARRGGCFTIGYQDSTLADGWSTVQIESYANAASGVTPPGTRKVQADAYRASDLVENVLTRFILPATWNGLVGDGTGAVASGSRKAACPTLDSNGNPVTTTSAAFWIPGLRIANWIPLRENMDYQSDAAAPLDANDDDVIPQYRRPFALYKLPSGKYVRADKANVLSGNEADSRKRGLKFSASVYPLADQPGIHIRPSSLAHAHASGTELTAINATFDQTTDIPRQVDWKDAVATVYAEFDEFASQTWPAVPRSGQNGQQSILEINAGPMFRLDYLAPNTVTDLSEGGELLINSSGGFLRDDRNSLLKIARTAWVWYSEMRRALTITVSHISDEFEIGQLLTTYNNETINSLVTYITYDFDNNSTTINTEFAEIDPVGMFV